MRPTLPVVTGYNIVLNGQPITINGIGANLGTRLSYVLNRDLQVGVNTAGVQPGSARLGANEALAPNAKLSIEASGTFLTSTFKQTVAELSGQGVLALDAGGTLAVGSSSTLDFQFRGEIVGTGTLEKAGSGTMIRRTNLQLPGTFNNAAGTLAIDGATIKADTAFNNAAGAEVQLVNLGSSIVSADVDQPRPHRRLGNGRGKSRQSADRYDSAAGSRQAALHWRVRITTPATSACWAEHRVHPARDERRDDGRHLRARDDHRRRRGPDQRRLLGVQRRQHRLSGRRRPTARAVRFRRSATQRRASTAISSITARFSRPLGRRPFF